MKRSELLDVLVAALESNGGKGTIIDLCRWIWANCISRLDPSDDLFYTWQYDVRWAATKLRRAGRMKDILVSPKGVWELQD